ncbi:MAG: hypothetical protein FWC65_01790, partial [Treponema sp.]|nr:hypothetical protein [Treponema sp.]
MMDTVVRAIKEHIADSNVCFVFPSQIAASRWAREVCASGIVRSVAESRFLAWDRFKEEVIKEHDMKRRPSSALMRKLFAESLIRKNGETVFLKSIIPPEYARGGNIFAPFISRLLPSLCLWEKLMDAKNGITRDSEDRDYEILKKEYSAFLERYSLFEPSWEETKIRQGNLRYVLFFPELIEDFAEYDAFLEAPQFIRITTENLPPSMRGGQNLVFYKSARQEIRSAVMELGRLHKEEGIAYEDMAVSVPGLEEMEPCLLREFALRHIPVVRRAGKKLGETGIGRLFALAHECAASQFSFSSLKALILNDHIPWKEREKNKALVYFGIKYNCVSSYTQYGKTVDIWEEAFKEAHNDSSFRAVATDLSPFYGELKKRIIALAESASFIDMRKHYFAFRHEFLDMGKISAEDDAVLSRCIVELSSLIDLEEMFGDSALIPSAPLSFFISCLSEAEYVKAGQKSGVNIFKWRVAAASPFACHFVLNASQAAASVLYQPMKFLRQDKRKALGLEDRDASGSFFMLYCIGASNGENRTRISASEQNFSGWAIPHSFFAQGKTVDALDALPCPQDPYNLERIFWQASERFDKTQNAAEPGKIFPTQKNAYESWKTVLAHKRNNFSFFASPVSTDCGGSDARQIQELLSAAIRGKDGYLAVTPTRDLNVYYSCPLFWLYARIFKTD